MLPISRPEANDEIRGRLSWREWQPTFVAAGLALLAVVGLFALFGGVEESTRSAVLEGLTNSIFWLATALIGSCGTIAALMLTTLSLMEHLETRGMGPRFLFHMRVTVLGAFGTILVSVLALLLTIFPSAGTENFAPPQWHVDVIYFGLLTATALMVGGFAVVLSSLYSTIADIFRNLPGSWVDDILTEDEAADREEELERAERRATPAIR